MKLSKWESIIVYYSKGWYDIVDSNLENDMKHFWSKRCGIEKEYVSKERIAKYLCNLIYKLCIKNKDDFFEFIKNIHKQNSDNYYMNVIKCCIIYISIIKVADIELIPIEETYDVFKQKGKE